MKKQIDHPLMLLKGNGRAWDYRTGGRSMKRQVKRYENSDKFEINGKEKAVGKTCVLRNPGPAFYGSGADMCGYGGRRAGI